MPIARRPKTGGRPANPVLAAYAERYRLTPKQKTLAANILPQLALCATEETRRLLLGVSR